MSGDSPAVSCRTCARSWNSRSMAEGLRLLGGCPRCGGELEFRDADATAPLSEFRAETVVALAPHMVMGMPRR